MNPTLTPVGSKFLSLRLSFQSIHKAHNVLLHLFIESTQLLIGQAILGFILIELILHLLREHLALLVILLHKCRIIKHLGRQFCFLLTDIITESCAVYLISTVLGSRKYDTQAVPEQVAENYKNLVYKLLGAKFTYHDEKELYLYFDAKAYGEFVDYYNNFIEPHLVTDMAFCKDWGGKYHGELLRLCGIIHCIKCALNDVNLMENHVTLDTFCNAIEIGEYFREQAIYAYSLGDVDLGTIKAERVLNKIRSKHIQQIRQNDLYKLCRCTLFKNAADFAETMDMLEEYGYLRRETIQGANGNNKSGIMVFINPNI